MAERAWMHRILDNASLTVRLDKNKHDLLRASKALLAYSGDCDGLCGSSLWAGCPVADMVEILRRIEHD